MLISVNCIYGFIGGYSDIYIYQIEVGDINNTLLGHNKGDPHSHLSYHSLRYEGVLCLLN